jgi:hypothetical protein
MEKLEKDLSPKTKRYTVKIPTNLDKPEEPLSYKEVQFDSKEEIMEFLNITNGQFIRLANNTLKFKSHTNSRLKGIVIERVNITEKKKIIPKETKEEEHKKFIQSLLDNVK